MKEIKILSLKNIFEKKLFEFIPQYIIVAWLPFVALVHRGAALLVPIIMVLSKPKLTQNIWAWMFVLWAIISVTWTPDPIRALRVAGCLALFLIVHPTREWPMLKGLFEKSVFAAFLVFIVMIWHHNSHDRSIALSYAPFALTLSLVCAAQPTWPLILCSLCVGWVSDCDTAILATFGIAIVRHAPLNWLKRMWKTLLLCVFVCLCSIHTLTDQQIQYFERVCPSFSYIHRIYIYRAISQLIQETPSSQQWHGVGIDSSRFVGQNTFQFSYGSNQHTHTSKVIPVHPHNIVLQIALELGWIGLMLAIICAWRASVYHRHQMLVICVAAGHALISVGAWQTWWMASVWLAYWLAGLEKISHES